MPAFFHDAWRDRVFLLSQGDTQMMVAMVNAARSQYCWSSADRLHEICGNPWSRAAAKADHRPRPLGTFGKAVLTPQRLTTHDRFKPYQEPVITWKLGPPLPAE